MHRENNRTVNSFESIVVDAGFEKAPNGAKSIICWLFFGRKQRYSSAHMFCDEIPLYLFGDDG